MASITFSGAYIAPASDYSDTLYLDAALSVSGDYTSPGELREYAGGRFRLVTRGTQRRQNQVSANYVSLTTREALEALVGQVVLYRDGRGRVFFGTILNAKATEIAGPASLCNVSFVVSEVTDTVEV